MRVLHRTMPRHGGYGEPGYPGGSSCKIFSLAYRWSSSTMMMLLPEDGGAAFVVKCKQRDDVGRSFLLPISSARYSFSQTSPVEKWGIDAWSAAFKWMYRVSIFPGRCWSFSGVGTSI